MAVWLTGRIAGLPPDEPLSAQPLFAEQHDRKRWIALFLAILELARTGVITLDQRGLFDPLLLTRTRYGTPVP